MKSNSKIFNVKIILRGDEMTGKSSLINRFSRDDFELEYTPTVGLQRITKKILYHSNAEQLILDFYDCEKLDQSEIYKYYLFNKAGGII